MDYSVKNIKTFQGHEWNGFECSLYKNGKNIGKVVETGSGGETNFYLNEGEEDILNTHCKSLPKYERSWTKGKMVETTSDLFIAELVDKFEMDKKKKKLCKTKILFRLKGDKKRNYRSFKGLYTPEIKKSLYMEHGDKIEEIVNETIK